MCKCSHFIKFSKTIEMTFPTCVGEGYGGSLSKLKENYQGCFLGTRVGGRFISAAKLIVSFPK